MKLSILLFALCLPLAGCGADADEGSAIRVTSLFGSNAVGAGSLAATDSVVARTRRLAVGMDAYVSDVFPDGQRVVLTDWSDGTIAIRDRASGPLTHVTLNPGAYERGFGYEARVSPDETRIAYYYQRLDLPDRIAMELKVVDLVDDGAGERTVSVAAEPATVFAPSVSENPSVLTWSPDGNSLLTAFRAEAGEYELILVPVDGGTHRVLRSLGWSSPGGAGFSPDGRYVAFDYLPAQEGAKRELHVMPVQGGRSTRILRHDANDSFLGWSADGFILFSSDRTGTPGVWRVLVENGSAASSPELVRPDLWRVTGLGFDAEGSYYYMSQTGMRDVYVASVDAVTGSIVLPQRPVVAPTASGTRSPEWSPDGTRMAYLTERGPAMGPTGGQLAVVIRSLQTGDTREHILPPGMVGVETLGWTADGRTVVLRAARDRGKPALLRVDVQTGQVERHHPADFGAFGVLPGTDLVFGRRSASHDGQLPAGEVVLHDLDTGEERVVVELGPTGGTPPGPIHTIAATPEGSTLAVALWQPIDGAPAHTRIVLHSLETGESRELLVHERPIWGTSLAFTPDGRGLYFSDRFDVGEDLSVDWIVRPWLVDIATGEKRELEHLPRMTTVIRPHPDGQRIATVAGQVETELWVMEDIAPVRRR